LSNVNQQESFVCLRQKLATSPVMVCMGNIFISAIRYESLSHHTVKSICLPQVDGASSVAKWSGNDIFAQVRNISFIRVEEIIKSTNDNTKDNIKL